MATSNTPPAWRRVFLRELARSGSVARAADKCGIDRSSAYQVRRANPAFAASWERALDAARERLAVVAPCVPADAGTQGDQPLPPFASSEVERPARGVSTDDEMSAVHPEPAEGLDTNGTEGVSGKLHLRPNETVRASKYGRPCIARAGAGRWSAASERAFLEALTATANVRASARAAGVSPQAVYNRRRQWPQFAAAWDEARAEGYARVEMLLLGKATEALDPDPAAAPGEGPEMSIAEALNLLKLHRAAERGGKPQRYGWRREEPDIEDVRQEILRKVAAMERVKG